MSKPKYTDSKQIKDLRERAKVLNQTLIKYKAFYRKRLNDETWRQTAVQRTWEYYTVKKEINLIYFALQQNNQLKRSHAKQQKLERHLHVEETYKERYFILSNRTAELREQFILANPQYGDEHLGELVHSPEACADRIKEFYKEKTDGKS